MEETKLTRAQIRRLKDDSGVEEWVKAVCPLCKTRDDDIKKYAPQQLFDHLMGRTHSKYELADFLQEEQTANHIYD